MDFEPYFKVCSLVSVRPKSIIGELRRPEGPPRGAPYSYGKQKEILMVIMASGIARGRVRTTTTTEESRKMATILQIIG